MNHKVTIQADGKSYDTFEDILPKEENATLDMLIVGKTPHPDSVKIGHYFQGTQGMSMWHKLEEYGLLKKTSTFHDDCLLSNAIGITDIAKVPRPTGNEPSFAEYIEGKERINAIISKYKPKVVFFVYKPVLEHLVPFLFKIDYGFNDNLNEYFNGSRTFLFPMPGTGKVTKEKIQRTMVDLRQYLNR